LNDQLRKQVTGQSSIVSLLLIFILPFAVVVYQLIAEIDVGIQFAQKERLGVKYNQALRSLLENVIEHRHLSNQYFDNKTNYQPKITIEQSQIDADIKSIDEVDCQLGETLKTTQRWTILKQKLQDIKAKALSLNRQESFEAHTKLIDGLLSLMLHVGDTSNLITDPVLDAYYLMDAVVTKLPPAIATTARVRDLNTEILADARISENEEAQITILSSSIKSPIDAVQRGMQVAFGFNSPLKPQLELNTKIALTTTNEFLKLVEQQMKSGQNIVIQPIDYFRSGTNAIEAQLKLYDQASSALDGLLEQRINGFSHKKYFVLAFSLLVLGAILCVLLAFARSQNKRKQSEQALRDAEEKYRTIFENAVDGIFQTTPDGHYLSANPALARIYGYASPEEP
jgi:PAS domain-containing protein